jgi:hypothetical protein
VTPGPTLPATELLGDLLMHQKKPAQALAAYQRSLDLYPGALTARWARRVPRRRSVNGVRTPLL